MPEVKETKTLGEIISYIDNSVAMLKRHMRMNQIGPALDHCGDIIDYTKRLEGGLSEVRKVRVASK